MEALLEQSVVAARLGRLRGADLSAGDKAALLALTALHDLGKINVGFQRKPFANAGRPAGHIKPLQALLGNADNTARAISDRLREAGGLARFQSLIGRPYALAEPYRCALAHHGRIDGEAGAPDHTLWSASKGYDPVVACRALTDAVASWFPAGCDLPSFAWPYPFGHAFAGLLTLADWLGSDESVFGYPEDCGAPPDGPERLDWARPRAAALLAQRGLTPDKVRSRAGGVRWSVKALAGFDAPSFAQAAMLSLPAPPEQGRLCLIEDETGSGKTEAALIHFLDLFKRGAVDGLYFALPTRAAAVQIHRRIQDHLRRILGPGAPAVVLAVPGYLAEGADQFAVVPDPGLLYPDDKSELARERIWSAERPNRYLASFVAVGTIDQVLMGGLRVRHALLRSAAMLRLLVVVDEVHSSDRYMTAILRNLLKQHLGAGGHALLMSATLGASARIRLFQREGRQKAPLPEAAIALPYPAIWTEAAAPIPRASENRDRKPKKTIAVELLDEWRDTSAIVARAVAAARAGARVLVIRNTVRLAVETQRLLEEQSADFGLRLTRPDGETVLCPHHARYAPEDRRRLDAALEARLGRNALRHEGSVTITTQTAEQSLDIDADLLITDLCPADVLLQRMGRLHRHALARPQGFTQPTALVIAPERSVLEATIDCEGKVRNAALGLGLVYRDLVGVLATRDTLTRRGTVNIPCDNRALVEAATNDNSLSQLAQDLSSPWLRHWKQVGGTNSAEILAARAVMVKWDEPLAGLSDDEVVRVRLGLDDRSFLLPPGTTGPFGTTISALSVPGRWLAGVPEDAELKPLAAEAGTFVLAHRCLRYDRFGLSLLPM